MPASSRRNSLPISCVALACAAALGLLAAAPPARADFQLQLSTSAGFTGPILTGNTDNFTFTSPAGDFGFRNALNVFTETNAPGIPDFALFQAAPDAMTNLGATTETLTIAVSATGFFDPSPLAGDALVNIIQGGVDTLNPGSASPGTVSFESCLFQDNAHHLDCAGADADIASGSLPFQSASPFHNVATTLIPGNPNTPYSLTEVMTVTLDPHIQVSVSGEAAIIPTPEPMSLAIFGIALLGLRAVRRARR